jgi:hypothetical protein
VSDGAIGENELIADDIVTSEAFCDGKERDPALQSFVKFEITMKQARGKYIHD